ncbi:contractile injection system protein, VgrG/Pvc8 family, partial [Schinkia azotoformans]|uniref:contractile injection system protein, VgrG/Pvc8 family n=1 Tax=Schinkia azotoformans TaxID=1454 RepID=UPI002E23B934|nr:contractile injection system protein, VgrG/Pvc8 family [Schinkia azotoformans]
MKTSEIGVGYDEMELVSPYDVQTLHDIQIMQTVNNHAKLYVTGMIPEEKKDSCLSMAKSGDPIELNQTKDETVVRSLFKGIVSKLSIRVVRDIYYIELEAISHTFQLDIKQKSRSFQNSAMIYKELVDKILADYPGADAMDHASQSTKLGKFIVQYKETDWQFLRRMASHFSAVLVPNATADSPKFHFGLPEGRAIELAVDHYSVAKDTGNYRYTTENGYAQQVQENDYFTYVVESKQYGNIGDRVTFKGKEFVVAQVKAMMQQGILTYEYGLAIEAGIRQNLIYAPSVKGSALKGSVIEVKKDHVRLHLEVDEAQNKNEATWFPYSPTYTAEGNSGIYWMPELGDTVQL